MGLATTQVDAVASSGRSDAVLPVAGRAVKRAIDIIVAVIGLVLTLPVLVAAMVAVRLDSAGPALFRQTRVGAGGGRFRLYRLRTMVVDNDDSAHQAYVAAMIRGEAKPNGGVYKLTDDPRVTRVGRTLRRYSVDELPQLWNVLRGDMSLIGPRPPLPSEVDLYDEWALQRLA